MANGGLGVEPDQAVQRMNSTMFFKKLPEIADPNLGNLFY